MHSFVTSIRLNNEDRDKLDNIAELLGLSQSDAVRHCIVCTWMELNKTSPETQNQLRKLNEMRSFLEKLAKS